MEWHHLYYKEVADSLLKKLTAATDSGDMDSFQIPDQPDDDTDDGPDVQPDDIHNPTRQNARDNTQRQGRISSGAARARDNTQRQGRFSPGTARARALARGSPSQGSLAESSQMGSSDTEGSFPNGGIGTTGKRMGDATSSFIAQGVDIMSAIQDSRDTFAEGISMTVPINIGVSSSTVDVEPTGTRTNYDTGAMSIKAPRHIC